MAISRLDTLSDIEAKERHIRAIADLLEDGKHINVAYGTQFLAALIEKRIDQHEQRNQGKECIEQVTLLENHLSGLGFDNWNQSLKTHKAILLKRFKDQAASQGWDLTQVEDLFTVIQQSTKPFQDAKLDIPCFMKA